MLTPPFVAGLGTAIGVMLLASASALPEAFGAAGQATPARVMSSQSAGTLATLRGSKPETLVTLDPKAIKGEPTRLSWSPDGAAIYLRVSQFDRWGNERPTHVTVTIASRSITPAPGEPDWAARYWLWKSARTSPAEPSWQLAFDARDELLRTTNVPREGNIGQHTADPNAGLDEVAARAALATQRVHVETLMLNGRLIDRADNGRVVPGRRFGWAPAPRTLIAIVTDKGRVALLDRDNRARELPDTKKARLPAWSQDGRAIAYVEEGRGGKFVLRLVRIQ